MIDSNMRKFPLLILAVVFGISVVGYLCILLSLFRLLTVKLLMYINTYLITYLNKRINKNKIVIVTKI